MSLVLQGHMIRRSSKKQHQFSLFQQQLTTDRDTRGTMPGAGSLKTHIQPAPPSLDTSSERYIHTETAGRARRARAESGEGASPSGTPEYPPTEPDQEACVARAAVAAWWRSRRRLMGCSSSSTGTPGAGWITCRGDGASDERDGETRS